MKNIRQDRMLILKDTDSDILVLINWEGKRLKKYKEVYLETKRLYIYFHLHQNQTLMKIQ